MSSKTQFSYLPNCYYYYYYYRRTFFEIFQTRPTRAVIRQLSPRYYLAAAKRMHIRPANEPQQQQHKHALFPLFFF